MRNSFLTEQEIKLLNLIKLIVEGGWIIDAGILIEVISIAGLQDIIKRHCEAKALDLTLSKEDQGIINTVRTLC